MTVLAWHSLLSGFKVGDALSAEQKQPPRFVNTAICISRHATSHGELLDATALWLGLPQLDKQYAEFAPRARTRQRKAAAQCRAKHYCPTRSWAVPTHQGLSHKDEPKALGTLGVEETFEDFEAMSVLRRFWRLRRA